MLTKMEIPNKSGQARLLPGTGQVLQAWTFVACLQVILHTACRKCGSCAPRRTAYKYGSSQANNGRWTRHTQNSESRRGFNHEFNHEFNQHFRLENFWEINCAIISRNSHPKWTEVVAWPCCQSESPQTCQSGCCCCSSQF